MTPLDEFGYSAAVLALQVLVVGVLVGAILVGLTSYLHGRYHRVMGGCEEHTETMKALAEATGWTQ